MPPRGFALLRLQSTLLLVIWTFLTVSISPELQSCVLIMCIDAPESTSNSRSSGLVEVGAGITFASIRVLNVVPSEFLSL